jgi:CheY-like chemotaxis protein
MSPAENGKTILLAEDHHPLRTFVLAMLEGCGYHVIVASDGQGALEKAKQFNGTIDLLLSDIEMPRMTGIELATQFQLDRPPQRFC